MHRQDVQSTTGNPGAKICLNIVGDSRSAESLDLVCSYRIRSHRYPTASRWLMRTNRADHLLLTAVLPVIDTLKQKLHFHPLTGKKNNWPSLMKYEVFLFWLLVSKVFFFEQIDNPKNSFFFAQNPIQFLWHLFFALIKHG